MGRTMVKLGAAEKAGADWIQNGQRSQPCNSE